MSELVTVTAPARKEAPQPLPGNVIRFPGAVARQGVGWRRTFGTRLPHGRRGNENSSGRVRPRSHTCFAPLPRLDEWPRLRGVLHGAAPRVWKNGSGHPQNFWVKYYSVHPRVCGEMPNQRSGRTPRSRGVLLRTIPACAGELLPIIPGIPEKLLLGSSPRVQGNARCRGQAKPHGWR